MAGFEWNRQGGKSLRGEDTADVIPGPLQAEPGIQRLGAVTACLACCPHGRRAHCGAPVWIPARRCAPSGMTSRKKGRAVRDDGKSKESAVRDDVKQISVPSGMTFCFLMSSRGRRRRSPGSSDLGLQRLASRVVRMGGARIGVAPVWIPARRCAPSGMTSKKVRAVRDDVSKRRVHRAGGRFAF